MFLQKKQADADSRYDIDTISRKGDRAVNEDSVGWECASSKILLALADGLGGHGLGDVASGIAVNTAKEKLNQAYSPKEYLDNVFCGAQQEILKQQQLLKNKNAMKTTLSIVLIRDEYVYYGHIGDSRIYFFSHGKYTSRTLDHSVPQMLALSGRIKDKDIRKHVDRNRLLRVLGVEDCLPKYELAERRTIARGDAILLCSDGFWEYISEKKMERTLKKVQTAEEWLKQMEKIVVKAGKKKNMDNYSAIALMVR